MRFDDEYYPHASSAHPYALPQPTPQMQQPPPPSLPPLPQLTDKFMKAYYYEFLDRFTPQHDMMHPEVSVGRQFQYDNEDKIFDANHMRNMSPEKREEWVRFYQDILDNNKMYKPFYPRQPSLIPHEDDQGQLFGPTAPSSNSIQAARYPAGNRTSRGISGMPGPYGFTYGGGPKSRGRKSRGRKSRGRKSRGRKSHGRKSRGKRV